MVEQTFGILKRRFSCLQGVLSTDPNQATKYVIACAILHNIGIDRGDIVDSTQDQVQLRGGNGNIIVAGDGVNIRNHIVDTYFT
uniref:DDE Tnp4 domain-containing protein n=1 Tax=Magallana gigas TaxID=29159 RepID=A0A8W8NTW8_MAGGI